MIDDALREELSALLDGALPEGRAAELRRRIAADADLRREYEELERAVAAVRALPRVRAPAVLRERLRGPVAAPPARARILRLGALAAAATVLLAAGLVLYLRGEPPVRLEARDGRPPQAPLDRGDVKVEEARSQLRDEQAFGEKSKDGPGGEPGALAKETRKRGSRDKLEAEDLLAQVARTKVIAEEDRDAYLRQVSSLGAEKALAHIRAVFPDEERQLLPEPRNDALPVLATIQLEDKDEANLVRGILDAAPKSDSGKASLQVTQEEKDQLTTEVEAAPADLARFARWLALLDVSRADAARPRVAVLGAAKPDEDAPKSRVAIVRLRYGKPPAAEPKGK
jgi:hypothetical protein